MYQLAHTGVSMAVYGVATVLVALGLLFTWIGKKLRGTRRRGN